jgi:hypothetical protein
MKNEGGNLLVGLFIGFKDKKERWLPQLRQKILILYAHNPDLRSSVGAWTAYDPTGQEKHTTGDSEEPPYKSVFHAMQDGWRVIQFPQQFPA